MKRRKFIYRSALGTISTFLGVEIVFANKLPTDYVPLVFQDPDPFELFGKDRQLVLLNDRPLNMEAQAHLLDDPLTPNKYMFIRNNGLVPEDIDIKDWTLNIDWGIR